MRWDGLERYECLFVHRWMDGCMIDIYCVIWMGLFLAFADMVSICSLLCVSAMCAIKMRNEGSTFYAFVFKIES